MTEKTAQLSDKKRENKDFFASSSVPRPARLLPPLSRLRKTEVLPKTRQTIYEHAT